MKRQSTRIDRLPTNFFAELETKIAAIQAQSGDVIRLDIGSPDLPPPPEAINVLCSSARRPNHHGYQPHNGTAKLRQAWAEMYRDRFGVWLDENKNILPLIGSKEGIFNLTMAWANPGDTVLVPDPGYMTYARGALFAGAKPYYFALHPQNAFLPDLTSIPQEVLKRAKMLWLNYPNNPTTAIAALDFFKQAVQFCLDYQLILCHDASYSQVCFEGYQAPSILQIEGAIECTVEFNSLSKSHNMAGWRTGVIVGNTEIIKPLIKLKTNLDSGHFRPILDGAAQALSTPESWLKARNEIYNQRRSVVLKALKALDLSAWSSPATIYVWCSVPAGWTSLKFVEDVLEKVRVSLTPGTLFGQFGEGYFRIALTSPIEKLSEAMDRLSKWKEK
ncbi:MAG: aminotransferase class I/II-fold pyridoxal phosphate-dependent enzyme [Anaerolineales bacterium]